MVTALVLILSLFVTVDVLCPDPTHRVHGHICRSFLAAIKVTIPEEEKPSVPRRVGHLRPPPPPGPPLLFSMAGGIELQLCKDRWQETLQPGWIFRVWRAHSMDLIAELPVPLVVQIVTHYLSQAGLTAAVMGLQEIQRKPLASAPPRGRALPVGVPDRVTQAARAAARRARKPPAPGVLPSRAKEDAP